MRKLLDPKINNLIKQTCAEGHRAIFVIIGDYGKDTVSTLHQLLTKYSTKASHEILWCYKKELELSSDRKKRRRQIKKRVRLGQQEQGESNPFELFLENNKVSFLLYRDSQKALGRTFQMCVFQDFEALRPNLLAQAVETVAGSGLVVFLLRKMSSLEQLSSLVMDSHKRFRCDSKNDKITRSRFNERFTLSLAECGSCLVMDDEMNILPAMTKLSIQNTDENPVQHELKTQLSKIHSSYLESKTELECLKEEMAETKPLIHLLRLCRTLDQAKALLSFADVFLSAAARAAVSLTAARGRGKTFACGLFAAYAVAVGGLSNVYVTSPFPQNLAPFFSSLCAGLSAVGLSKHGDFEVVRSARKDAEGLVVRVNVFAKHSQFVQYIEPFDSEAVAKSQAQLLVIDEAAAIPLPLTKALLSSSTLTVLSSTTSGYEGTGRALTLKLLKTLRSQKPPPKLRPSKCARNAEILSKPIALREASLSEPIRYAPGDPVERWLSQLLCLAAPSQEQRLLSAPHPAGCELCLVDRDALFSGHPIAETFLARLMSLVVSAHYRNSPDDLQLLSDAPAHRLFALVEKGAQGIPAVLCVVQVAFEGALGEKVVQRGFRERVQSAGDLIPWTLATQYQREEFAGLSGMRVVRVATHTECQGMGYGSRAVELLESLLSSSSSAGKKGDREEPANTDSGGDASGIPHLLTPVADLYFENIDWIGASFGLTKQLFTFWSKCGFKAVYVRQSTNKLTGEHSCIVLKGLRPDSLPVIDFLSREFSTRFRTLLSFNFRNLPATLALSLIHSCSPLLSSTTSPPSITFNKQKVEFSLSANAIKRLDSYCTGLIDFSTIVDILPATSDLYFAGSFGALKLSFIQQAVLLAVGLQRRKIESLAEELGLGNSQLLGLFAKAARRLSKALKEGLGKTD